MGKNKINFKDMTAQELGTATAKVIVEHYGSHNYKTFVDAVNKELYPFKFSELTEVKIEGIDLRDYPKFTDAYLAEARYKGILLTDEELLRVQVENLTEFGAAVYEAAINKAK